MEYDKMEVNECADFSKQSKHIKVQQDFCDMMWEVLQNSPYTYGELAARLDWELNYFMMVITGDKTIDFYEAVHLAGALGYKLEISIKEVDDERGN